MNSRMVGLIACLALCLCACLPTRLEIRQARDRVERVQETRLDCRDTDRCAIASPLRALAAADLAASTDTAPSHHVTLLEYGQDALLARIHLIRAARERIDLQSYILVDDDAGQFVLLELLAAARRGVRVRVLIDQVFGFDDLARLKLLATSHVNFEMRLYSPPYGEAHTGSFKFLVGILCCFTRFNQRMHNKLLLIDGLVGITGGRNIQNRYFDWDPGFNYRDRDVLLTGPVGAHMQRGFEQFWRHRRSVPIAALRDVRQALDETGAPAPPAVLARGERMLDLSAMADSATVIEQRFVRPAYAVGRVDFYTDRPNKPFERNTAEERDLSARLRRLLRSAQEQVVLQTPYLLFSRAAQREFRQLQDGPDSPRVIVSTNSLASTDAFPVYALAHKYRRRYLREFGFEIHEFKPFPAHVPIDMSAAGVIDREVLGAWATEARRAFGSSATSRRPRRWRGPLPLRQAGMRIGLHAKSMVLDERISMVGTHNFDPRSDRINTESFVLVHDPEFARALRRLILNDTRPENAWTIAPRPKPPLLSGLNYSIGKFSEVLPIFDVWPWKYATSYEINRGCEPVHYKDPKFAECYTLVGDFPEVDLIGKGIYTRIITAFGAGLAPIL